MTTPQTSIATTRLVTSSVAAHPLSTSSLHPGDVVDGDPTAADCSLVELGATSLGLWELTPGTVTDTEVDEVFLVVAGRAVVTFSDGSELALAPGVVVRLRAGDRTTWKVTETLRKVWIMN